MVAIGWFAEVLCSADDAMAAREVRPFAPVIGVIMVNAERPDAEPCPSVVRFAANVMGVPATWPGEVVGLPTTPIAIGDPTTNEVALAELMKTPGGVDVSTKT